MNEFIKVHPMIRKAILPLLLSMIAPAVFAQNTELGMLLGSNEPINDSLGLDTSHDVNEIYFGKAIEEGTWFRIKAGEADLSGESLDDGLAPEEDSQLRYALALVAYEFDEIFGSTVLFAGPGAYKLERAGMDDSDELGFALGVGTDFPVTRKLGVVAELTYHWVNFDSELRFLNLGIGARYRF